METYTKKPESTQEKPHDENNKSKNDKTFEHVKDYSHKGKSKITQRLTEIENEWDIERIIHLHVSGMSLTGVLLAFFVDKRWLILPAAAAAILVLHSMKGIAPQVQVLKKLGFRTKAEIDREKFSIKAMRGDFKHNDSAEEMWEAAV